MDWMSYLFFHCFIKDTYVLIINKPEAISSIMANLEMVKTIVLQMWNFRLVIFCYLNSLWQKLKENHCQIVGRYAYSQMDSFCHFKFCYKIKNGFKIDRDESHYYLKWEVYNFLACNLQGKWGRKKRQLHQSRTSSLLLHYGQNRTITFRQYDIILFSFF